MGFRFGRRRRSTFVYIIILILVIFILIQISIEPLTNLLNEQSDDTNSEEDTTMQLRRIRYENYMKSEKSRTGPGEGGRPYELPGEERIKGDNIFKIDGFNPLTSDAISLDRSIIDTRLPALVVLS